MRLLRLRDDRESSLVKCLSRFRDDNRFSLVEVFGKDIPRYAILSHCWGADHEEVTYRDMEKGTGKSKAGYAKIRFCEKQAAKDGLQYFWVDTCCIDKSNSVELQEAINSMFSWYKNATKCYVYLSDVSRPAMGVNDKFGQLPRESSFWKSRWFTRGWTLQELLAPTSVEFFSKESEKIGNKKSLERFLAEITGIPVKALQGSPLSSFSTMEQISWQENRETKREEDKAYSLLGICGVHMPLIYGEGRENAFKRLGEEINKASKDATVGDPGAKSTSSVSSSPSKLVYPEPITVKGFTICKGIAESRISWLEKLEYRCHLDNFNCDIYESKNKVVEVFFSSDHLAVMDMIKEEIRLGRVRNILDFISLACDLKIQHAMDGHIECHLKRGSRYFSISEVNSGAYGVEVFRTFEEVGEYHIWIKTQPDFTPSWDLEQVEEQEARVMAIRKTALGSEHPDTLTRIVNLASTYRSRGQLKEAKELFMQSMDTLKKVLGAEHADTLNSMVSLASTCRSLGQLEEAEELFKQAAEISKKLLGLEHSGTLYIMNNLAVLGKPDGKSGHLELQDEAGCMDGLEENGLVLGSKERRRISMCLLV